MLRWLVGNMLRETAQRTFAEAAQAGAAAAGQADPDEEVEPLRPRVVVSFALGVEAGGLIDCLKQARFSRCANFTEFLGYLDEVPVSVIQTGVGREAAGQAVDDAIRMYQPEWVVSSGFVGALCDEARRGHLVMPEEVCARSGESFAVGLKLDDEALAANPALHAGRLVTVDQLIRTSDEKRKLGEQFSAMVCDMESSAIAKVCAAHETRHLVVRIVSDSVNDELPVEVGKLLDQKSWAGKLGAATGAIFNRPSSVKDMWKLKEDALKASDRLARFLSSTIRQL